MKLEHALGDVQSDQGEHRSFVALGKRDAAEEYLASLRARLQNPFLVHRLADIAQNHSQKKKRRFEPVVSLAERHAPMLRQPRLRAALAHGGP